VLLVVVGCGCGPHPGIGDRDPAPEDLAYSRKRQAGDNDTDGWKRQR